jgi:hypothetical protein
MRLPPDGHIGIFGASQIVVYGLPTHATAEEFEPLILIGTKRIVGRCTAVANGFRVAVINSLFSVLPK